MRSWSEECDGSIGRCARRWANACGGSGRRQWAAAEARDLGWGGVTAVAEATGLSRVTITAGLRELEQPARKRAAEATRVRRPGGGRKPLLEADPALLPALEALIEPMTRGDPESPLAVDLQEYTPAG